MQSCECCGLSEECTRSYMGRVRAAYCGRYVCGLCAEAVKEELGRSKSVATMEEALSAHMKVCAQFHHAAWADPLVQLANVAELMRQILRKSSDGGSSPNSLKRPMSLSSQQWRSALLPSGIARSNSCFTLKGPSDLP